MTRKWLWAAFYLLTVPVFALLYSQHPYGFYHGTIMYEEGFRAQRYTLLKEMRVAILENNKEIRGDTAFESGGNLVSLAALVLEEPRLTSTGIAFDAYTQVSDEQGHLARKKFSFSVNDSMELSENGKHYLACQLLQSDFDVKAAQIFPGDSVRKSGAGLAVLSITEEQFQLYLDFMNASLGFPHDSDGHYARMLYLSAVTITTLGFGDVVPITDTTRSLVALESILGVVFIGLFLNALSARRKTDK